ncbi:S16 family serine protease [Psychrobacillus sp. FSL W7-1457]|uniref:S16 family serine protease n=1 Tax=unclassified Psychrobacillus TaxID=2636677 RepID=UPI0030F61D83
MIITIVFYLLVLGLFLRDAIDGISYLVLLLLSLFMLIISIFIFRRKQKTKKQLTIALAILLLLFCYELPLLGFVTKTYVANLYVEPRQTVEGSGIFIVSVSYKPLDNMKSQQEVRKYLRNHPDLEVINVAKITNEILYENKNRTIFEWLQLKKTPKEEMRENLKLYFGKEEARLTEYFKHDKAIGDSAGLSLLLTELIIKGELQNDLRLAITGAIDAEGNVLAIGGLREKLQNVNKYGFPFIIIPSENAKEAETLQRELKLNIEVFDVEHVEEAIEVINDLNEKYKK